MGRRPDLDSVLVIGSGPIVIGQACEFDYAGTQALRALRAEGVRTVLLNSNPATIMTDPELADATYIEPITLDVLDAILAREQPRAVLPTLGGQTALNLALAAVKGGVLARHDVHLIGVSERSIELAEDRALFKQAMARIGLACPRSALARSVGEAQAIARDLGFPVILRPSFTLGGSGGGIARTPAELAPLAAFGLDQSPVRELLVEESVLGWKEFELEVVRDARDNCIIVCSIENLDPMGVHTGDSITVAPAQTLTDKEYQRLRDAAFAVVREIGVTTGGANVQFAVDPKTGRMVVIEMNPRVSRSSALASKATGFPIAKVATQLALGYTLDELRNDLTRVMPASFEPALDYVVVKWPRFAFEKFAGAPGSPKIDDTLGPQMRSVGEAMAIGRTFREALGKALRSLETGRAGFDQPFGTADDLAALERQLAAPTADRLFQLGRAFQLGLSIERAHALTWIDPWFLHHLRAAALAELELAGRALGVGAPVLDPVAPLGSALAAGLAAIDLRAAKRSGLSDRRIAALAGATEADVRAARRAAGLAPVYKRVDTCAAEYATDTAYLYSTYEADCEARPSSRKKVIILGGGPNRIGQGIEFDYCCVHAAQAVRELGLEAIMVNCNPETVSTDYDTADRLYFEPLTVEDVLEICAVEARAGELLGVIVQLGGQTPLKLATPLAAAGIPLLGTPADAIDRAEDRARAGALVAACGLRAPRWGIAHDLAAARRVAAELGFPVMVRPSYVLGGRAMAVIDDAEQLDRYVRGIVVASGAQGAPHEREAATIGFPLLLDQYLAGAIELDVDVLADRTGATLVGGVMEHVEPAGIHSGDSACALPPYSLPAALVAEAGRAACALATELGAIGLVNAQLAVHEGALYVLEVNPRASRTVPFVSKAVGAPLAKLATKLMCGETLASLGVSIAPPRAVCVKEVVLPFLKFAGADPVLGPEMRSTGEVMGIAPDFARAYGKAQRAAGNALPLAGAGVVGLAGADDEVAAAFAELGFAIARDPDDATLLAFAVCLSPDSALRRAAVRAGIPYVTTRRAALASALAIHAAEVPGPMNTSPVQRL
ncbi:MAG TPA: carbamoyl-phosphate synthase large subunit [Kofleriaceae bacterium]|jgi:carbamoyl-phosphate synthase large subunit